MTTQFLVLSLYINLFLVRSGSCGQTQSPFISLEVCRRVPQTAISSKNFSFKFVNKNGKNIMREGM